MAIKLCSGSGDLTFVWLQFNLLLLEKLFKLFTKLGAPDMEALIVVRSDPVIVVFDAKYFLSFYYILIKLCNLLSVRLCVFLSNSFLMFKYLLREFQDGSALNWNWFICCCCFSYSLKFYVPCGLVQTQRSTILSGDFRKIVQIDVKHFNYYC